MKPSDNEARSNLRTREGVIAALRSLAQRMAIVPGVSIETRQGLDVLRAPLTRPRKNGQSWFAAGETVLGVAKDGLSVNVTITEPTVDRYVNGRILCDSENLCLFLDDMSYPQIDKTDIQTPLATRIEQLLMRLNLDVLSALRHCFSFNDSTYTFLAANNRADIVAMLNQWPCLAQMTASTIRKNMHFPDERVDGDALLEGGLEGLATFCSQKDKTNAIHPANIMAVLAMLKGQEFFTDTSSAIRSSSLCRMALTNCVPRTPSEWSAFTKISEILDFAECDMPISLIYQDFDGSWIGFATKLDAAGIDRNFVLSKCKWPRLTKTPIRKSSLTGFSAGTRSAAAIPAKPVPFEHPAIATAMPSHMPYLEKQKFISAPSRHTNFNSNASDDDNDSYIDARDASNVAAAIIDAATWLFSPPSSPMAKTSPANDSSVSDDPGPADTTSDDFTIADDSSNDSPSDDSSDSN